MRSSSNLHVSSCFRRDRERLETGTRQRPRTLVLREVLVQVRYTAILLFLSMLGQWRFKLSRVLTNNETHPDQARVAGNREELEETILLPSIVRINTPTDASVPKNKGALQCLIISCGKLNPARFDSLNQL